MPRFQFSLRNTTTVREAGVVHSDSFADALSAIGEHLSAVEGDTLEIGVTGFPPARFEYVRGVGSLDMDVQWRPAGLLAA
jgi:hypothetical protein